MAEDLDHKLRQEIRDKAVEQEEHARELLGQIREDSNISAKEKLKLNETLKKLDKTTNTALGDLGKNFKTMGTGLQTTVDGMINETFGPLGGVVTTFTTGFFKRSKERKENELKAIALEEQAMAQAEAILNDKEQTDDTKEIKEHQ